VSATPRLCRIPALSASSALGVAHAAITARFSPPFRAVELSPLSSVCGVGHAASIATSIMVLPPFPFGRVLLSEQSGVGHAPSACRSKYVLPLLSESCCRGQCGVCHPEQPLSPVRRSDARSAQIGSPAGISQSFQVKANSGEPFTSILARNLLSKHRCRSPLGDEIVKSGPKVALVGVSLSLASARKRLTRTGASPDSGNAFESGPPQGERPSADPGEEVALVVSVEVFRFEVKYAPFVHCPGRQVPFRNQLTQPSASLRVIVVVEVQLFSLPFRVFRACPA